MTLLNVINKWKFFDVSDIVSEFGLESVFINKYGMDVYEFNFDDIGEIIIVEELLDCIPNRNFHCDFLEEFDEDYYYVVEYE
jgi:hypothetical protein